MSKRVIIIGAGISGIAAAMELVNNGLEVVLLETKASIGGRFYSFADKTTGEIIDNGQHIFVGAYKTFFQILEELGTMSLLKRQDSLRISFYDNTGIKSLLDTSLLGGKAGMAAGLIRLKKISLKSKFNALVFFKEVINNKVEVKENETAFDLLIRYRQGNDIIERFWGPMVVATLNNDVRSAPGSLLVQVLKSAFFAGEESARIYLCRTALSELIKPFEGWLSERGGEILYYNSVDKILHNEKEVLFVQSKNGFKYSADAYISTVQYNVLENIVPVLKLFGNETLKKHLQFSTIISVYCWYDKEFIEDEFAALLGTNIQWVFNKRKIAMTDETIRVIFPCHLALTISAANDLNKLNQEEIINIVRSELDEVFPSSRNAKLLHYKIIKDNRATLKITPEIERYRPLPTTEYKNLFLAGDWTSTKLPATVEGAAISGFNAAREVMKYLSSND
jgi:zeta-carotene desaturase